MRCVTTAPKLVAHLLQGCSKLVRTTCVLAAAGYAFERILYLCSRLADGESANTLKVAAAATEKGNIANDADGIHVDSDKSAACATGYVF
jgi:hypothetical protein